MSEEVVPAVKALIEKDGEILVLETEASDEVYYVLPGGKIEYGEEAEEALKREMKEEISSLKRNNRNYQRLFDDIENKEALFLRPQSMSVDDDNNFYYVSGWGVSTCDKAPPEISKTLKSKDEQILSYQKDLSLLSKDLNKIPKWVKKLFGLK